MKKIATILLVCMCLQSCATVYQTGRISSGLTDYTKEKASDNFQMIGAGTLWLVPAVLTDVILSPAELLSLIIQNKPSYMTIPGWYDAGYNARYNYDFITAERDDDTNLKKIKKEK